MELKGHIIHREWTMRRFCNIISTLLKDQSTHYTQGLPISGLQLIEKILSRRQEHQEFLLHFLTHVSVSKCIAKRQCRICKESLTYHITAFVIAIERDRSNLESWLFHFLGCHLGWLNSMDFSCLDCKVRNNNNYLLELLRRLNEMLCIKCIV